MFYVKSWVQGCFAKCQAEIYLGSIQLADQLCTNQMSPFLGNGIS